jgi:hypothetical protein
VLESFSAVNASYPALLAMAVVLLLLVLVAVRVVARTVSAKRSTKD